MDDVLDYVKEGIAVVVYTTPVVGPHAGHNIGVIVDRQELSSLLRDIVTMQKAQKNRILKSIRSSVRSALMDPTDPNKNPDLMSDIAILFAIKLVTGSDKVLNNSGLMSLMLFIDSDTNLPWQQRGMLDPEEIKIYGLDERPSIML